MSLRDKTIAGVVWSGVQKWGARVLGSVVFFLLVRLLDPEDFGLIALAGVFIAFAEVILSQGFTQAIVQRESLEPEHPDSAFWTSVGLGATLTVGGVLVAPLLAHTFSEPALTPIVRWLSLGFMLNSLSSVQDALLQRDFAYKSLAYRQLLGLIAGGGVGVTMAFLGYGVWSLVAQQLVTVLISTVMLWVLSDWRPSFRFSKRHFDDLFAFEVNELGSRILNFFTRRSDDLLIGYFLGPVALGFYTVAYRVLFIMTDLFTSSLSSVSFSLFSRLQSDKDAMRRNFLNATRLSSLFAFPAFIGLGVLAPEFVRGVLGEQWSASTLVLQILLVVGILQSVSLFNNVVMKAMGKPSWVLKFTLVAAVGNVVGFLIAVHYGIEAVAAAYVIRAYLTAPLAIYLVGKLIDLNYGVYLRQYASPLIGSVIMVAAILLAKTFLPETSALLALVSCTVLGAGVYIGTIRLLAPDLFAYAFDLFDQAFLKSFTRRLNA